MLTSFCFWSVDVDVTAGRQFCMHMIKWTTDASIPILHVWRNKVYVILRIFAMHSECWNSEVVWKNIMYLYLKNFCVRVCESVSRIASDWKPYMYGHNII